MAQVFSCEFCKISKNIFSTEQLLTTASETVEMLSVSGRYASTLIVAVKNFVEVLMILFAKLWHTSFFGCMSVF